MAPLHPRFALSAISLPLLLLLLLLLSVLSLTSAHSALPRTFRTRALNETSWQQYVRAPSSTTLAPVRWLPQYSHGNITNGDGIVGSGVTTLARHTASDEVPSIVLDFGQNYAGVLSIDFAGAAAAQASSALPGLALAFSESLECLTNRSDFTRSDNQPAGEKVTASGTDRIAVQLAPYTWTNQLGCQYPDEKKVCSDGFHGFRYVRISLQANASDAPYTTGLGSVSIDSVRLAYSAFQGTPNTFTGWFECSDTDLTRWWYDAVYTNDLTTDVFRANDTEPRNATSPSLLGKEVLFDGAKRDRDPYVGDLAVSALTLYLSHDNPLAARNVLADLAEHQRSDGWIPPASINNYTLALFDYPLWWVVCSSDLVLYTGDTDYLATYYPTLVKTLDTYYPNATNADGLLQKGLGTSAGYGDYAFLPRTGVITYYNALYVLALTRAAQLAEIQGAPADAARWRERAARVAPALVAENWDASAGAFYDGGPCSTDGTGKCDVHAQDGNGLAILSGVTSLAAAGGVGDAMSAHERDSSILAFCTTALARPYGNAFYDKSTLSPDSQFDQRVYAFISYFELAARFQVASSSSSSNASSSSSSDDDIAASAYDQLARLYGHMASHDPFSTFWEGIGPNGSYYQQGFTSLAHGWSTGIVPLMQNYVLGVRPTGPGFSTFEVKPVTSGGMLDWARGAVATPRGGRIGVHWRRLTGEDEGGVGLRLTVETPAGDVQGRVYVPLGARAQVVRVDAEVMWTREGGLVVGNGNGTAAAAVEEGYVVFVVQAGSTHVFTVETSL